MNKATEIYLALGFDKVPALRRIAASLACSYWLEMARHGVFEANQQALAKLVNRFKLGDLVCALSAHYPLSLGNRLPI